MTWGGAFAASPRGHPVGNHSVHIYVMERGALCKRMTEGCAVAPLSRYFSAPAVEQEDAADLPQPHGTLKIWHSGQSIDDREKEHSVRSGASPERTIPHTTDNITYKEVITNEN